MSKGPDIRTSKAEVPHRVDGKQRDPSIRNLTPIKPAKKLKCQEAGQSETHSRANLNQRHPPVPQVDLRPLCLALNPYSTIHYCAILSRLLNLCLTFLVFGMIVIT